ncbi:hypothetical protein VTG60DRAFT_270 [Thermothelomyces hinnuleus]
MHKGEPQPQRYDFWEQEKRIDTLRPISKRPGTEGKATDTRSAPRGRSTLLLKKDLLQACPLHADPSKNKVHRATSKTYCG